MKLATLQDKVNESIRAYRANRMRLYRKEVKEHGVTAYSTNLLSTALEGTPFNSLKFKKTLGVFNRSNCRLDMINEIGHSYDWYEIFKRINKTYVLNTYAYSKTTRSHVSEIAFVLRELGVKFIEIEAPKGLQDLECAASHMLITGAMQYVKAKHARKRTSFDLKAFKASLKPLKRLGVEVNQTDIIEAIQFAEDDRVRSSESRAKDRAQSKAKAFLDRLTQGQTNQATIDAVAETFS